MKFIPTIGANEYLTCFAKIIYKCVTFRLV